MIASVIQELLNRRPFVPFELRYGDEGYLVAEAGLARIVDEDSTLAIFDPKSSETTFVNLLVIQRVKVRGRMLNS